MVGDGIREELLGTGHADTVPEPSGRAVTAGPGDGDGSGGSRRTDPGIGQLASPSGLHAGACAGWFEAVLAIRRARRFDLPRLGLHPREREPFRGATQSLRKNNCHKFRETAYSGAQLD